MPLLFEVLDRQEVRATFFVPGAVAERYQGRVAESPPPAIDYALHGYTHTSPDRLEVAEEEAELTKSLAVLSEFAPAIAGYRSPSWDFSPATLGLLEKHGLGYSADFMDDVRPYLHPGTDIVELPVQWMLDDTPRTSGSVPTTGCGASRRRRPSRRSGGPSSRASTISVGCRCSPCTPS